MSSSDPMAALAAQLLTGTVTIRSRRGAAEKRKSEALSSTKSAARKWTPLIRSVVAAKPTAKILAAVEETDPENVDARDHKGRTALYFAVRDVDCDDSVVLALLDKGANPLLGHLTKINASTTSALSPLVKAVLLEDWHRASLLWNRSRDAAPHPLALATLEDELPHGNLLNDFATGRYFSARWLMETLGEDYVVSCAGPSVPTDFNALDTALMNNQLVLAETMVEVLERKGLDRRLVFVPKPGRSFSCEFQGSTILHRLAAQNKSDALLFALRRMKLSPDEVRADGMTPLHVAVSALAAESVLMLVLAGASRNVEAVVNPLKPAMTAYDFARKKKKHGHGSLSGAVMRALKP